MFYHSLHIRRCVWQSFSWAMTSVPSWAWSLQRGSSPKASTLEVKRAESASSLVPSEAYLKALQKHLDSKTDLDTGGRWVAAALEEKEDKPGQDGSLEEVEELNDLSPGGKGGSL